ncbi:MAG: hypothetical protein NTZ10_03720 [Candidatus Saganbacteria bacterium]|nr:hypothetical protein [Candidatus Saganbacteria bacterium]
MLPDPALVKTDPKIQETGNGLTSRTTATPRTVITPVPDLSRPAYRVLGSFTQEQEKFPFATTERFSFMIDTISYMRPFAVGRSYLSEMKKHQEAILNFRKQEGEGNNGATENRIRTEQSLRRSKQDFLGYCGHNDDSISLKELLSSYHAQESGYNSQIAVQTEIILKNHNKQYVIIVITGDAEAIKKMNDMLNAMREKFKDKQPARSMIEKEITACGEQATKLISIATENDIKIDPALLEQMRAISATPIKEMPQIAKNETAVDADMPKVITIITKIWTAATEVYESALRMAKRILAGIIEARKADEKENETAYEKRHEQKLADSKITEKVRLRAQEFMKSLETTFASSNARKRMNEVLTYPTLNTPEEIARSIAMAIGSDNKARKANT